MSDETLEIKSEEVGVFPTSMGIKPEQDLYNLEYQESELFRPDESLNNFDPSRIDLHSDETYVIESKLTTGGLARLFNVVNKVTGEKLIGRTLITKSYTTFAELVKFSKTLLYEVKVMLKAKEDGIQSIAQIIDLNFIKVTSDRGRFKFFLPMIIMERGELNARKLLPEMGVREFKSMSLAVAKGLDYFHGHNLVHGDVTLSNIMRRDDGSYFLIDFTGAITGGMDKLKNFLYGNLQYNRSIVAPEVVQHYELRGSDLGNEKIVHKQKRLEGIIFDGKADQYSFAVGCYECLTGSKLKFGAIDQDEDRTALDSIDREFFDDPNLDLLPKNIADVLYKALDFEAEGRYATCTEFVTELLRAIDEAKFEITHNKDAEK